MIHVDNFGSLICSGTIKDEMERISQSIYMILGINLIGIYLGGSLSRGCYNPQTSDVDIMIVLAKTCSAGEKKAILDAISTVEIAFDVCSVTTDQLNQDTFPTPIDFLIKMNNQIVELPEGSKDFLFKRQDIYEVGVDLFGKSHMELIRAVPWPLLSQCVDYVFPNIRKKFKNPVLMMAKAVYTYQKRRLCSKVEAGVWAMEALDPQFQSLIEIDLNCYRSGILPKFEDSVLTKFEKCCLKFMQKT